MRWAAIPYLAVRNVRHETHPSTRSTLAKVNLSSQTSVDLKLIWGNLSWIWQLLFLSCAKFCIGWFPALENCLYGPWPKARIRTALAFLLSLSLIEKISISGEIVNGFFIGFSSSSSGRSARNEWGCRIGETKFHGAVQRHSRVLHHTCRAGSVLPAAAGEVLKQEQELDRAYKQPVIQLRPLYCLWHLTISADQVGISARVFESLELFYPFHHIVGRGIWIQVFPLT